MTCQICAYCLAFAGLSISISTTPVSPASKWVHTDEPTHRLVLGGVPQFGKLNKNVWRSGQPLAEGAKRLTAMGVNTIVDLRDGHVEDRRLFPENIRYIHIPVRDMKPPTDAQASHVLRIVTDPSNWPVLLHCDMGEGRIGVMTAVIRWSLDGWDDKKIMRELNNFRVARLGILKIPLGGSERHFIRQWELKNTRGGYVAQK